MGEEQGLKPCPFCGGRDVDMHRQFVSDLHWAVCDRCKADGPTKMGEAAAVLAWNTRAEGLQPPVGEVEGEVFSSLGASKAPSCGSPTVPETPSGGWRSMETAPRDRVILLYGPLTQASDSHPKGPIRATGFWCEIDGWSLVSTTWEGPFIEPVLWAPLPAIPTDCQTSGGEA